MRPLKPDAMNKKMKPSRFFDYFIRQYGQVGTSRATVLEIQKNLRSFFLDLAFGNIVQEKYTQFILGDPRIVDEALIEVTSKLKKNMIYMEALNIAAQTGSPITQYPEYNECYSQETLRHYTYSILHQGLSNFKMTQDPSHLVFISTQFNSQIARGAKQVLLL